MIVKIYSAVIDAQGNKREMQDHFYVTRYHDSKHSSLVFLGVKFGPKIFSPLYEKSDLTVEIFSICRISVIELT